jgi:NAD(P)-dependent dehydrogenase (short-subunit alcohol dehydrogenase family)
VIAMADNEALESGDGAESRVFFLSGAPESLAHDLGELLDARPVHLTLDTESEATAAQAIARYPGEWPDRIVWLHAVKAQPAAGPAASRPAAEEVAGIEAAINLAEAVAASLARQLVFMFLAPAPGLYRDSRSSHLATSAAEALTRTKTPEWAQRGWRLATIIYGPTDGLDAVAWKDRDQLVRRVPMSRFGTLAELAGVVKFMASDAAAYLTGTTIRSDGGWNAYSWIYPYRTI